MAEDDFIWINIGNNGTKDVKVKAAAVLGWQIVGGTTQRLEATDKGDNGDHPWVMATVLFLRVWMGWPTICQVRLG